MQQMFQETTNIEERPEPPTDMRSQESYANGGISQIDLKNARFA